MKILVETTGAFQLVHTELNEHVRSHGKTIIEKSQWAQEKVSIGQLLVTLQLSDEATDAEWLDTLRDSDGDEALALASFEDRYPVDAASARRPEPAPLPPTTAQVPHNRRGAPHKPK